MTAKEQKKAAADFAAKWIGRGYEKGECQKSGAAFCMTFSAGILAVHELEKRRSVAEGRL